MATLRQKKPRVVVLIGQCVQEWEPLPKRRAAMDQLAKEEGAPGGPVLTVDHSRGWVSDPKLPNTLTVDWAHPDAAGDERRARRLHTPA